MKLTEQKLREIIREELNSLNEANDARKLGRKMYKSIEKDKKTEMWNDIEDSEYVAIVFYHDDVKGGSVQINVQAWDGEINIFGDGINWTGDKVSNMKDITKQIEIFNKQ